MAMTLAAWRSLATGEKCSSDGSIWGDLSYWNGL